MKATSEKIDQQLDAVVRAGLFRDRRHALCEATRSLFSIRPHLKTEAAIELFRSGDISLLRGAEIAGLDFETFRSLLRERAIPWEVETTPPGDMDQAITSFFGETAE